MSETLEFKRPTSDGNDGARILVADDDAGLQRSLSRILGAEGYAVETVSDGQAAIELLSQRPFDAVLSDIQMPGMSGLELLQVVRAYDLDLPVVLMTGDPRVETAADAVEHGALRYLLKPIAKEDLLATMGRAVRLHRMARWKREALRAIGSPDTLPADRAGLEGSFERALETLTVAFQPIVSLRRQDVFAYEALLRSREPTLPDPGAVLGAAEQLGRLDQLGRRVRMLAAAALKTAEPRALLFVNLHPRDLLDPELASAKSPLAAIASRVVLEITERAPLDGIPNMQHHVATLRHIGFRFALDDLGAGHAGLGAFAVLEPEFVKLDMQLVRDVHRSTVKQRIIGAMTAMCEELGTRVVCEGIEAQEECDELIRQKGDLMQGYLFARPGPPFPSPVFGRSKPPAPRT
jgi:EAL domain-containing protein (putative c-di-GMP-specific phosphodiesterase class I)